jgi:hypothetical protein
MLDELQAIDATAIEELRTLKSEQGTLQERLEKLDERRGSVSEVVFERVRSDYESRLEELEARAEPLRQQARGEFARLTALLERMATAVEDARLDCEELELRHELGELEHEPFEQQMATARETLERCESELHEGGSLKETFLSAVHSEEELLAPAESDAVSDAVSDADNEAEAEAEPDEAAGPDAMPDAEAGAEAGAEATAADDAPPAEEEPTEAEDETVQAEEASGEGPDAGGPGIPDVPSRTVAFDPFEPDPSMLGAEARAETHSETEDGPEDELQGEPTQMFEIARLVSAGPGERGSEHRLNPTTTTIGRAPGNDIRIDDPSVSRRHARIDMVENGYTVVDLGAENGVFVNHQRVTEQLLADGDLIELGPGGRAFVFRGA